MQAILPKSSIGTRRLETRHVRLDGDKAIVTDVNYVKGKDDKGVAYDRKIRFTDTWINAMAAGRSGHRRELVCLHRCRQPKNKYDRLFACRWLYQMKCRLTACTSFQIKFFLDYVLLWVYKLCVKAHLNPQGLEIASRNCSFSPYEVNYLWLSNLRSAI